MIKTKSRSRSSKLKHTYFRLVRQYPLRSISNDTELDAAQAVIDALLRQQLDEGADAYLDALSDLVVLYEQDHHAISPLPPHALLTHLLAECDLSQADLVRKTGIAKATVSDLVSGKRPFTVEHMRRIAAVFGLPATTFMADVAK